MFKLIPKKFALIAVLGLGAVYALAEQDLYHTNKAKEKLENLTKSAKMGMEASKNDNLDSLLNSRNTNLSDIVGSDTLSAQDKIDINLMESIAIELAEDGKTINCTNIANYSSSDTITKDRCDSLNERFSENFKAGTNSIFIPDGSSLNEHKGRINIDNSLEDGKELRKKIIHSKKEMDRLIRRVKYIEDEETLLRLMKKINKKSFIDKSTLANAIKSKAIELGLNVSTDDWKYSFNQHKKTVGYGDRKVAVVAEDNTDEEMEIENKEVDESVDKTEDEDETSSETGDAVACYAKFMENYNTCNAKAVQYESGCVLQGNQFVLKDLKSVDDDELNNKVYKTPMDYKVLTSFKLYEFKSDAKKWDVEWDGEPDLFVVSAGVVGRAVNTDNYEISTTYGSDRFEVTCSGDQFIMTPHTDGW